MLIPVHRFIKSYAAAREGIAAVEFALIFPILFTMIIGVWGVGNGVLVDQKAIAASQIMADLLCRNASVTQDDIDEAINAAKLAISPFSTATFSVDIISVQYDASSNPQIVWRETSPGATPDSKLLGKTAGLGGPGEGALAAEVNYAYTPLIAASTWGKFYLREISFGRGRKSAVISKTP